MIKPVSIFTTEAGDCLAIRERANSERLFAVSKFDADRSEERALS